MDHEGAGDGGIDFVSRLDLGSGSGSLKLVVLGQAKCIAGCARLRVDWTWRELSPVWTEAGLAHSSRPAISAIRPSERSIADRFPLLMLNGRHVGETVAEWALRGLQFQTTSRRSTPIDGRLSNRLPAEILHD